MAMENEGLSSTFNTYKRIVTSTEVSFASHTSQSSYLKESATDFLSSQGTLSGTKELISGSETKPLPLYVAIQDYVPEKENTDGLQIEHGQVVEVLDSRNSASWLVRIKVGWVPGSYFETPSSYYRHHSDTGELTDSTNAQSPTPEAAVQKRQLLYQELLKTEEDFVAALRHVIDNYVSVLDDPVTPTHLRSLKDQLFMNVRDIYNFHANALLKGMQYYVDDPGKIGQTFVRLERDFDHHVRYCRDHFEAIRLLDGDQAVKAFYQDKASKIETQNLQLVDYIQLPVNRVQKYQEYIREFIKCAAQAGEETKDLRQALELLLSIPQRANDLAYTRNIADYPGDTTKLGRLLRHDFFCVSEGSRSATAELRYVFLFRNKLVITNRKDSEDPDELPEFSYLCSIRLDKYRVSEDGNALVLQPHDSAQTRFILEPVDKENAEFIDKAWLRDIAETKESTTVDDEEMETMTEFADISDAKSEFSEYSTAAHSRTSSVALGEGDAPPRKKPAKSPPQISPSASSGSIFGSTVDLTAGTSGGNLEMQGTRITKTQYGFRTLQESSAKMCLKVSGFPLPVITWFKDGEQLQNDERHSFYSDEEGFFAMTIDPVLVEDTGRYTCVATNEYGQATTSAFFRVVKMEHEPSAPSFVKSLDDKSVPEGASVQLECEVGGWPEPEIMWLVDGQIIHPSQDFKIDYDGQKALLEIRDAQPDDSGVYSIRISNEFGTKESIARITVLEDPEKQKVPPEFQQIIHDTLAEEGSTVRFKVVCTGDPTPEVSWLINGSVLTPSDNIDFLAEDGIYIVTIRNVTSHFGGEVQCRAANRIGETSCSARLTIRAKDLAPYFSQQLKDVSARVGDGARFEASVDSNQPPNVSWYINDEDIKDFNNVEIISEPGKGIFALQFHKVSPEMSGMNVTCAVENDYGFAKCTAKLLVEPPSHEAPIFGQRLADQMVRMGDSAKFEVKVESHEPLDIVWFMQDKEVQESALVSVSSQPHDSIYSLVLQQVRPEMAGTITVRASNRLGTAESLAQLTVDTSAFDAPRFEKQIADQLVEPHKQAKFEAKIASARPLQVDWLLNGVPIPGAENIKIFANADDGTYSILFLDVSSDVTGVVTCKATNANGTTESNAKMALDTKFQPPILKRPLSDQYVKPGEIARFEIALEPTEAALEVSWLPEDSADLRVRALPRDGVYFLVMPNVALDSDVSVTCKVKNDYGTQESNARLIVDKSCCVPPIFKQPLQNQTAKPDESATFEAIVESFAKPIDVKWMIGNQEVDPLSTKGLTVSSSQQDGVFAIMLNSIAPSMARVITCKASNIYGEATSKAELIIDTTGYSPPVFSQPLSDQSVKPGEKAKFEVMLEPDKKLPTVTWIINGIEVTDETTGIKVRSLPRDGVYYVIVDNITADTKATVTCKAGNTCGISETSAELIVDASACKPPVFVKQLEDQTAKAGDLTKFEAILEQTDSPPVVKWYINDKEVQDSFDCRIRSLPRDGIYSFLVSAVCVGSMEQTTITCRAANAYGEAVSKALLSKDASFGAMQASTNKGISPPILLQGLVDKEAHLGGRVQFFAKLKRDEDEPMSRARWFINNAELNYATDISVIANPSGGIFELEIARLAREMAGVISCELFNEFGSITTSANLVVKEATGIAPVLEQTLYDLSGRVGQKAKFDVKLAPSSSPCNARWFLNDAEVVPSNVFKLRSTPDQFYLEIDGLAEDMSGTITCKVSNEAGEAVTSAKLNVVPATKRIGQAKPEFQSKLSAVSTVEGHPFSTKVIITGDPVPYVKWYINKRLILPSDNIQLLSDDGVYTLSVNTAKPEMSGELKCVAFNKMGEVSSSAPLAVARRVPVEFEQYLADTTCQEGDTLKLRAVLLGQPSPQVSWYINGKKLVETQNIKIYNEAGAYIVVISNITCDYSGEVLCKAVNEYGEASSSATLLVVPRGVPPDFTEWLSNVATRDGSEVRLHVVFTGEPTPIVSWMINEKPLDQDPNVEVRTTDNTSSLIIKKFSKEYLGEIMVRAENEAGEVSCTAQLQYKPETDVSEHSNLEAFAMDFEDEDDAATDNAVSIAEDELQLDRELLITVPVDESPRIGTPIMSPRFITRITDVRANRGKKAIFECLVPESKGIVVKWLKDGNEIELIAKIRVLSRPTGAGAEEHQLVIEDVQVEDVGEYQVVITNANGTELCAAKLLVEEAPRFIRRCQACSIFESESAVFECQITGHPEPLVKWHRGTLDLADSPNAKIEASVDGTQRLTLRNTRLSDAGEYSCEISNSAGRDHCAAALIVKQNLWQERGLEPTAEFTSALQSQAVIVGETVYFECRLQSNVPPSKITWSKNSQEIASDSKHRIERFPDGTQRLIIHTAEISDSGGYKCEAMVENKLVSTQAPLNVRAAPLRPEKQFIQTAPAFLVPLGSTSVRQGQEALFECIVTAEARAAVRWLKDGVDVMPSRQLKIVSFGDGKQQLRITEAHLEDVGTYTCVASNPIGTAESSGQLVVTPSELAGHGTAAPMAPEFVLSLKNTTAAPQDTITLTCKVVGSPTPEIRWFKDRVPLIHDREHFTEEAADGTQTLTIRAAAPADAAYYKCEATNSLGSAQTIAELKVAHVQLVSSDEGSALRFQTPLSRCIVDLDEDARFECVLAKTTTAPTIRWLKDGQIIHPSATYRIESLQDGRERLTVAHATNSDIGIYSCEAVTSLERAETHAPLQIYAARTGTLQPFDSSVPEFTIPLQSCIAIDTNQVKFECVLAPMPTKPEIHWYKDGRELKPNHAHTIESLPDGTQRLTIVQAVDSDIGSYTCEAIAPAGSARTEASLKLRSGQQRGERWESETAPAFVEPLRREEKVRIGEDAVLQCKVVGQPPPEIRWYKDDETVRPDDAHACEGARDGTQRLIVKRTSIVDEAEYKCEAVNIVGHAVTVGQLKVADEAGEKPFEDAPPSFATLLSRCCVNESEEAHFECILRATASKPEVRWLKDGREIWPDQSHRIESLPDGTQRLSIKAATPNDEGRYACEAASRAGKAKTEAPLEIRTARTGTLQPFDSSVPEFTIPLQSCIAIDTNQVKFECVLAPMPTKPEIHWYKDGRELKPNHAHTIESLPDGTQRLTIVQAVDSDIGSYTCEAIAPAGSARTEASLKLRSGQQRGERWESETAPAFVEPLRREEKVRIGEDAVLQCKVVGQPPPEIRWYKDDETVRPDDAHACEGARDGTQRLIVKRTSIVDEAKYKCEAVNIVGHAVTVGQLKVADEAGEKPFEDAPPSFATSLSRCCVNESEEAHFECILRATASKPEVRWLKDGREIWPDQSHRIESLPDGTQRLSIRAATPNDEGHYACEAASRAGKATTEAPLEIRVGRQEALRPFDTSVPEFTTPLQSRIAIDKEEVRFQCVLAATATKPEIHWYKDGRELKPNHAHTIESLPDGTQRLTIVQAVDSDIGSYTCEAIAPAGSARTEASLKLKTGQQREEKWAAESAPAFVEPLRREEKVRIGEDAVLQCKVVGQPPPEIRWYKDDETVRPDDAHACEGARDGTQRLVIKRTSVADEAEYKCEAINVAGSATTVGQLKVATQAETTPFHAELPEFVTKLHAVNVDEGQQVVMECAIAKLTVPPRVDWYKDGVQIRPNENLSLASLPDGTQRLTISATAKGDVGEYACKQVTPAGAAETQAPLRVNVASESVIEAEEAPRFLRELERSQADEGSTVAMECQIRSVPAPNVRWYKDGKPVEPSDHIKITANEDGTQRLVISGARPEDQGNYKCEATNPAGTMSSRAPLTVRVAEEMEVDFLPESSQPLATGAAVAEKAQPVSVVDTGEGQAQRAEPMDVDVVSAAKPAAAPRFLKTLSDIQIEAQATAELRCEVSGDPFPEIIWCKDGVAVTSSRRVYTDVSAQGSCVLKVEEAQSTDAGHYTCMIRNPHGEAETCCEVSVKATVPLKAPEFVRQLENRTVAVDDTVVLEVEVSAEGASFAWTKNGVPLRSTTNARVEIINPKVSRLSLVKVNKQDGASYACQATNEVGTAKTSCRLTIEAKDDKGNKIGPTIAKCLKDVTVKEGATIRLQVHIEGGKPSTVRWFKEGKEVTANARVKITQIDDHVYELLISEAVKNDEAAYLVKAENNFGKAASEAAVVVEEEPVKITSVLKDVRAEEGAEATFEAKIIGRASSVKWYKNHSEVLTSTKRVHADKVAEDTFRLKLDEVAMDDAATYRVVFTNAAGETESQATLTVLPLPAKPPPVPEEELFLSFRRKLVDQTVAPKADVILEAETNSVPPSVRWLKNGREVSTSGKCKIESSGTIFRLTILDAQKDADEAEYTLEVSNKTGAVNTRAMVRVAGKAPSFSKELYDRTVSAASKVVLEVEITGKPTKVQWYHNGREVKEDVKELPTQGDDKLYQLVIAHADKANEGTYSVVATNDFGRAESKGNLVITGTGPRFAKGIESKTAAPGDTVSFTAEIDGEPKTVKWRKNGKDVAADARIKIEKLDDKTYKLTIPSVTVDDNAQFTVLATNDFGACESDAFLTVQLPPKPFEAKPQEQEIGVSARFILPLKDQGTDAGSDLVLTCVVSGDPFPEIAWLKDGIEIENSAETKLSTDLAGQCKLLLKNCKPQDAGAYVCIAQNKHGSDRTQCNVSISEAKAPAESKEAGRTPPRFLSPLNDKSVPEGEDLVLEVKIDGKPMPDVVWFKNGEELKPSDRTIGQIQSIGDEVTFRLTIRDAKKDDAGGYRCVATNSAGTATSEGTVKVEPKKAEPEEPPKFIIPLRDMNVTEGNSVSFDVKIRGRPVPALKWLKDNVPLEVGNRIKQEDLADGYWKLTISDAVMDDFGTYKCIATNSRGKDECSCDLSVKSPKDRRKATEEKFAPKFNVPLHDRCLPEHSLMSIQCFVAAQPAPEIKWFKDGVELDANAPKYQIKTSPSDGQCSLTIVDFSREDEGLYKCQATNELGQAQTKANLTSEVRREEEKVTRNEYAPRFLKDLRDQSVPPGDPVTLECKVDAVPSANIQWFKDGMPIKPSPSCKIEMTPDGTCRLVLANTAEAQEGAYRCLATNTVGSSNTAGYLTVLKAKSEEKVLGEGPQILDSLRDCRVDKGKEIFLKVRVSGTPTPELKWFKDGVPLRASDRLTFEVTDDGLSSLLIIRDCQTSDAGLYRVLVENLYGTANTLGNLAVDVPHEKKKVQISEGEPPRFVIPLEDTTCAQDSAVELECKVLGDPQPSLKWYKDGTILKQSSRVILESCPDNRHKLRILKSTLSDEGVYRCVASNDSGQATTKAQLNVGSPVAALPPNAVSPKCVLPLSDLRLTQDSPLSLECKMVGVPPPDIEWFKDGERIQPSDRIKIENLNDGTCRLWIANALPNDEGMYRCIARSPIGHANTKCNVSVKPNFAALPKGASAELARQQAPEFVIPLSPQTTKEGFSSLRLTCKVAGVPMPSIKWFKDGERIFPQARVDQKLLQDGSIELTITNVQIGDSGCYRCVAENDFGTANTRAEITVEPKAAKSFEVRKSESLIDFKKGKAPGFLKPLTVCRVDSGAQARFSCLPFGEPFPEIKWLKDGMEISQAERFVIAALEDGTQTLTINDANQSDEGFYRCVATNSFGTASSKAELIVEVDKQKDRLPRGADRQMANGVPDVDEPPRFRRGLKNVTTAEGSVAQFECAISGVPKPAVKWFKGNEELKPSEKILFWSDDFGIQRLVILDAQLADESEYRCEISNSLGHAKTEAMLSVLKERLPRFGTAIDLAALEHGRRKPDDVQVHPTAPGFLKQLRNRHVFSQTPAIFDCVVCGTPPPEIEWYHNGQRIVPDDRIKIKSCGGRSHALIILWSLPGDEGEYYCKATNMYGTASSAAVLDVTVPFDKLLIDYPRDVAVLPADDYLFKQTAVSSGVPGPPDKGPFIAEVTGHYLTLSWIPTRRAPPRYPQVTYVVEMRELPDRDWIVVDYNIPQPCCKVRNLLLGKSYQFRVRAENLYGISEPSPPSPPSQLMAPPKPVLDKHRRPIPIKDPYTMQAMYKIYGEQYSCAPWFAPRESNKFYCGDHGSLEVALFVYGFPEPEVRWNCKGAPLDQTARGRHRTYSNRGSESILAIRDFNGEDVGLYECKATNAYGEAVETISIELAEVPTFVLPLENKVFRTDQEVRLDCKIEGNPVPEVKWLKDYHIIVDSYRTKILREEPNLFSLLISDPLCSDSGLYTCTAVNEAGRASSTATISIDNHRDDIDWEPPKKQMAFKPRKIREFYRTEPTHSASASALS